MAAFATLALAEARAVTKVEDGTWVAAHACRDDDGTIVVRALRRMTKTDWGTVDATVATTKAGAWAFIDDDATD